MNKTIKYCIGLLALLLTSCSPWWENETPEAQDVIRMYPCTEKVKSTTRATVFEQETALRGDEIYVYAYLNDKPYFSSILKWLDVVLENIHEWHFYNGSAYVEYYWPTDETAHVDIFAYFPYKAHLQKVKIASETKALVEVSSPESLQSAHPSFSCQLPVNNEALDPVDLANGFVNQDLMTEFMFAYTINRQKDAGDVPLQFIHPFAAISFEAKQAHRGLRINSLGFKNVYTSGTCALGQSSGNVTMEWSESNLGNRTDMTLLVDKVIPDDINFGGKICSDPSNPKPMLMLPQSFGNDLVFFINYEWDQDNDNVIEAGESFAKEVSITSIQNHTQWEAGYKYTYVLDLGNMREEILFEVQVEDWEYVFDHELVVE